MKLRAAKALHDRHEKAMDWRYLGYRRRAWEEIGEDLQAEYFAVVQAVLDGEKEYRGTKIATRIKEIVHEEMGKES